MGNISLGVLLAVSLTVLRFPHGVEHDYLSDVHAVPRGFTTAVVSWNVQTPGEAWIETQLRARISDRWTRFYDMGHWSRDLSFRGSVKAPADADGHVDTDTLVLRTEALAWQVRVIFHAGAKFSTPKLSLLAVTTDTEAPRSQAQGDKHAWGVDLEVPERTQRVHESPDALGGGGDAWCSPTSVSMLMGYWAARTHHPQWDVNVATSAGGTYDPVYAGCGNWPFNVAFASERGLEGWVERLASMTDMERYIALAIPLIASIRVAPGELEGSPYAKTEGHLLVVRGFTRDGNVITNDPYALPGHIRIIYRRDQFEHVWMNGSHGIVYVIGPPDILRTLR